MKRAFQVWRFESKLKKQVEIEEDFKQKHQNFGIKYLEKTFKNKSKDNLRSALKMMLIKSADVKAKIRS